MYVRKIKSRKSICFQIGEKYDHVLLRAKIILNIDEEKNIKQVIDNTRLENVPF